MYKVDIHQFCNYSTIVYLASYPAISWQLIQSSVVATLWSIHPCKIHTIFTCMLVISWNILLYSYKYNSTCKLHQTLFCITSQMMSVKMMHMAWLVWDVRQQVAAHTHTHTRTRVHTRTHTCIWLWLYIAYVTVAMGWAKS